MVGRRYRPAEYNRGAAWDDDSIEELAQETAVELLVGEGQIDYIFTVADSTEDVRRLLARNVKRALWRRRSSTVVDRLMSTRSRACFTDRRSSPSRWEHSNGSLLQTHPAIPVR